MRDFRPGQDKISFVGGNGPTSMDDLILTEQGSGTLVAYHGQEMFVANIAAGSWSDSDFLFG